MSDFLTNLVVRSFSPTAAVQPVGASFYSEPGLSRDPAEEFADPFVETFAETPTSVHAEEQPAPPSPPAPPPPSALPPPPAPPPPPALPRKQEPKSVFLREDSFPPSVSQLTEPSLPADPSPADVIPVTKPAETKPGKTKRTETKPPKTKRAETEPTEVAVTKPADVTTTVQRAPVTNPQPSLRKLMRKPAHTVSLSPQTSSSRLAQSRLSQSRVEQSRVEQSRVEQSRREESSLAQPQSRTTGQTELPIVERIIERTQASPAETAREAEREQTIVSFTTLVPKASTQALLPVSFKSRSNVQPSDAPEEPAVEAPPETVINVAIGRIEVRATSAPAPKRERQANGPKVMNLDDYMQQRSRGAK